MSIEVRQAGFLEACYHEGIGKELMKMALKGHWDEGVGFVIAVNYLLSARAHVGTRVRRLARLDRGTLPEKLQQVKDLYINEYSEKQNQHRLGYTQQPP